MCYFMMYHNLLSHTLLLARYHALWGWFYYYYFLLLVTQLHYLLFSKRGADLSLKTCIFIDEIEVTEMCKWTKHTILLVFSSLM